MRRAALLVALLLVGCGELEPLTPAQACAVHAQRWEQLTPREREWSSMGEYLALELEACRIAGHL